MIIIGSYRNKIILIFLEVDEITLNSIILGNPWNYYPFLLNKKMIIACK